MTTRRGVLGLVAMAMFLGAAPGRVEARCAQLPLAQEIEQSRYVFEGTVESMDARAITLRVVATWKGSPPATVRVAISGRGNPFADATATTVFLVFASGTSDEHLSAHRCGATGQVGSVPPAQLEAAGLHRTAR